MAGGYHRRNRSRNDGFVDTHSQAPERDSGEGHPFSAKEGERRVRGSHDRQRHEDPESEAIEQLSERERASAADTHGDRVEHCRHATGEYRRLLEVKGDEREVCETGRDQTRGGQVDTETPRRP